ncbi:MAG: hypothetical protein A2381_00330 [Bdellovibrionales bacterium RIFOXYB1_FULL_37_110]|nr:MAG: hypothetical protein A2417_11385 [Bdellovibrionales bacterium RIFOXYC1_FULL_37_79]OFZ60840.1 MAG: hypothetical protein A2381_00330 [Bdellovibrionales bacterium RIFOXYB1_FULL_37_110]OFZ62370.1 MAG: hypothetical protein A2577_02995 [Bdellovibrionales bacterium RIFOXYD1_FULL_36_51]
MPSNSLIKLAACFLFISCARLETLNLSDHKYGVSPKRIIWFQIPGLNEDHISMLRFNVSLADKRSAFENFSCLGKIWGYNLYDLRPSAASGLFAQMVGKENITKTCGDFDHIPIWNYLATLGYKTGILESGAQDNESLDYTLICKDKASIFLDQAIFFRMAQAKSSDKSLFHFQDREFFEKNKIYYDRTCQKGSCFASLDGNLESILSRFKIERGRYLFIVRDFTYLNALKKRDIRQARVILSELDQIVTKFLELQKSDSEMLLLITSSESIGFDFPKAGTEWANFEKKGDNPGYRSPLLMFPVMAKGAGAENFCGIYKESEILERILKSQMVKRIFPLL